MASNSTISISFELKDGKDGLKSLTLSAKDLQKFLGATVTQADKLNKKFINFAAIATGVDSINNTLKSLQSGINDLSGAYAAQIEAEKKLETTMRNSMGAREEDIKSIKALCSAQQELGVIGDEVQLAGAQEMATYLGEKASLEKLIPVMNDMLAQQYGLNATQESAANIATMLGKVMNGQVGALSRYGYTFDKAQEQILKYGTEAQRAAVLCEVVSASVGGMNAELAKTDVGKQKQLENTLGDLKEKAGELAQKLNKIVFPLSNLTIAAGIIFKFITGMRTATAVVKGFNMVKKSMTMLMFMGTGSMAKAEAAVRVFAGVLKSATARAITFKIALKGLANATIIGVAFTAITAVIGNLAGAYQKGVEEANKLAEAQERLKRAGEGAKRLAEEENSVRANTLSLLELNIAKLKEFSGTKTEEKKLVDEMNNTYGETMGYFSSVSDWYKTLIANSETYCRQMVLEAKARTLANLIAEKEVERDKEQQKINAGEYSSKRDTRTIGASATYDADGRVSYNYTVEDIIGSSELDQAQARVEAYDQSIEALKSTLSETAKEAANLTLAITGSTNRPGDTTNGKGQVKAAEGSLKYLEEQLSKLKAEFELAIDDRSRQKLMAEIKKIESEKHVIEMRIEAQYNRPDEFDAEKAVQNSKFNVSPIIEKPKDLQLEKVETGDNPLDEKAEQMKKLNEQLGQGAAITGALSSCFGNLGQAIGGAAGEWLNFVGGFLGSAQQLLTALQAMTMGQGMFAAAQTPIIGWLQVGAAAAAVAASFASLPKFANGGIISGPTVGLMGEYAGASNNPEVVAPLDKLRGLLQPIDNNSGGVVKFKIEGRTLVGVLERENNLTRRS